MINGRNKNYKSAHDFFISDMLLNRSLIPGFYELLNTCHTDIFKSEPRYLGVQELGASSVNLKFIAEVGEADIYSGARILNHDLFLGMRKLGIECPFTQVDFHSK